MDKMELSFPNNLIGKSILTIFTIGLFILSYFLLKEGDLFLPIFFLLLGVFFFFGIFNKCTATFNGSNVLVLKKMIFPYARKRFDLKESKVIIHKSYQMVGEAGGDVYKVIIMNDKSKITIIDFPKLSEAEEVKNKIDGYSAKVLNKL
jgi:hypothetical protein